MYKTRNLIVVKDKNIKATREKDNLVSPLTYSSKKARNNREKVEALTVVLKNCLSVSYKKRDSAMVRLLVLGYVN